MRRNLALTVAPITHEEFVMAPAVAKKLRQATQTIVSRGAYVNPDGVDMSIASQQRQSLAQQRVYDASQQIDAIGGRYTQAQTYVYNQTTLTIARERVRQGYRVAILHFANPGWSQRSSAGRATQEESLMRSSSLPYCMDAVSVPASAPFYDDTVIVTPQVPVFREHAGDLLEAPWQSEMVHAIAVDVYAVRQHMPEREAEIPQVMLQRAQRVLQAAATTRANVLVLGAWGCGRAGHDPAVMAAIWQVAIAQAKVRMFGIFDFAVADIKATQPTFSSFYRRLHQQQFDLI